jgi:hypothetical protein
VLHGTYLNVLTLTKPQLLAKFHTGSAQYVIALNILPCTRTCKCCRVISLRQSYLLTYLLTYTLVQEIIWKANCHSACQKILLPLWNPKVHYRVHKSPPMDPILSQPNPVRPIDPYLPKYHLNIILLPTPRCSQRSLTFRPPNQNPVNTSPLPHACHTSRPPHPPWFNHPNIIRWRIQVMKFIIMQLSPWSVSLPFRSTYLPQNPVLKTLSRCSSTPLIRLYGVVLSENTGTTLPFLPLEYCKEFLS